MRDLDAKLLLVFNGSRVYKSLGHHEKSWPADMHPRGCLCQVSGFLGCDVLEGTYDHTEALACIIKRSFLLDIYVLYIKEEFSAIYLFSYNISCL